MPIDVTLLVFGSVGQRTIAAPPKIMEKIKTYTRNASSCGLADIDIANDIASYWPSVRRTVEVKTLGTGEIWVTMTPTKQSSDSRLVTQKDHLALLGEIGDRPEPVGSCRGDGRAAPARS